MASYDDEYEEDDVLPPLEYVDDYEEGVDPPFEDVVDYGDNVINWFPDPHYYVYPPRLRQEDSYAPMVVVVGATNPLSHRYFYL